MRMRCRAQVPVFFTVLGNAAAFERGGKVRLLRSPRSNHRAPSRSADDRGIGFPLRRVPVVRLLAPANTPREIVTLLAAEITAPCPYRRSASGSRLLARARRRSGRRLSEVMKTDFDKCSRDCAERTSRWNDAAFKLCEREALQ